MTYSIKIQFKGAEYKDDRDVFELITDIPLETIDTIIEDIYYTLVSKPKLATPKPKKT